MFKKLLFSLIFISLFGNVSALILRRITPAQRAQLAEIQRQQVEFNRQLVAEHEQAERARAERDARELAALLNTELEPGEVPVNAEALVAQELALWDMGRHVAVEAERIRLLDAEIAELRAALQAAQQREEAERIRLLDAEIAETWAALQAGIRQDFNAARAYIASWFGY